LVEQVPFFVIGGLDQFKFLVGPPLFSEFHSVVLVLGEVDVIFHHILEVLGDDGDPDVVLVVDDDVEDFGSKDFALDHEDDVGLVEGELLFDKLVDFVLLR
jgi:hypothetical protein